jgi:glycerol dehydrogenase-like iron-containing ADH family enzyme
VIPRLARSGRRTEVHRGRRSRLLVRGGLPITLAGIGLHELPRDRLDPIARRGTAPGETIHNEPFAITPEMVADAILTADAPGRAWKNQRGLG